LVGGRGAASRPVQQDVTFVFRQGAPRAEEIAEAQYVLIAFGGHRAVRADALGALLAPQTPPFAPGVEEDTGFGVGEWLQRPPTLVGAAGHRQAPSWRAFVQRAPIWSRISCIVCVPLRFGG